MKDATGAGRVVLSRKGFDASAGGAPSPVLGDGRLVSLPIPEADTGARYDDLCAGDGRSYTAVMQGAGITRVRTEGRWVPFDGSLHAHVDPDLVAGTRPRGPGWRPAFGQAGAAQTVLARAGVGVGDLFLFFGWFRPAREQRRDEHVIWGWLRVGEVLTQAPWPRWLRDHPHAVDDTRTNNTVYVAADEAFPGVPGAGVLHYDQRLVLTAPDATRRADWLLPACFGTATLLPRHRRRLATDGRFDARFQWQEFVAAAIPEVDDWAASLLRAAL